MIMVNAEKAHFEEDSLFLNECGKFNIILQLSGIIYFELNICGDGSNDNQGVFLKFKNW